MGLNPNPCFVALIDSSYVAFWSVLISLWPSVFSSEKWKMETGLRKKLNDVNVYEINHEMLWGGINLAHP